VPGIDEEDIVLTPSAPLTPIQYSPGGWGGNRCQIDAGAETLATVPIPSGFTVPTDNDNASAAFLAADGRTVVSTQPLARCTAGGPATSYIRYPDADLYGDGIAGAHGGSGMSSLGGSIRVGELRPGQVGPKHALKVSIYARGELSTCATRADCFRWPARKSDGYAVGWYGAATSNKNTAMKMGSLLAIPPTVNVAAMGLKTEPARQLAWTLQNYGAYIVDDTYGPSFDIDAEKGPAGSLSTQFRSDYGYAFETRTSSSSSWSTDLQRIRQALSVVNNNSATSVGGGGTPRQPLAPQVSPPVTAAATDATSSLLGSLLN
jgi:hypothetical protein